MITDPIELEEARKTTADLISEEPTPVALVRKVWTRTPSGGVKSGPPQDLPVVNRFFGGIVGQPRIIRAQNGEQVVATYVLIGTFDDDIQEEDEFSIGDKKFRVAEVAQDNGYETRAWVIDRA